MDEDKKLFRNFRRVHKWDGWWRILCSKFQGSANGIYKSKMAISFDRGYKQAEGFFTSQKRPFEQPAHSLRRHRNPVKSQPSALIGPDQRATPFRSSWSTSRLFSSQEWNFWTFVMGICDWKLRLADCRHRNMAMNEETQQQLQEITDLLVAAGYFRARIKTLPAFDKVGSNTICHWQCLK